MKYVVSFRNLYGNVEVANIEASGFEIVDGALCFLKEHNNHDAPIPMFKLCNYAFNDWIHVSESKEEAPQAEKQA